MRLRSRRTPPAAPAAAALTLLAAGPHAVTGWLGGELTFRKRIGVVPAADLT